VPGALTPGRRRVLPAISALFLLLALAAVAAPGAAHHLRALALLSTVVGATDPTGLTALVTHDVTVRETAVAASGRRLRARAYAPVGVAAPHGVVLLHGIHPDGIDEARLVAFARALAATGAPVLTPELADLVARRMTASTIDDIDRVVRAHAESTEHPVGVWGICVAGGLALLAAAQPGAESRFDHVVAVGAHADRARVVRFHSGEAVRGPDGEAPTAPPHRYGKQVILSAHVPDLAAVSPRGRLAGLQIPVFLVHGSDDPIIPAFETRDLAREVPAQALRGALVTPVLRHAEAAGTPDAADAWALVRFVAAVLAEAED
jgi:hypothetical protein